MTTKYIIDLDFLEYSQKFENLLTLRMGDKVVKTILKDDPLHGHTGEDILKTKVRK